MSGKASSVTIVYEEVSNKPTHAVNGAYGGPSPDGTTVIMHVYTEFGTVPSIEEYEVPASGVVNTSKGHKIKRADITRQVQATLMMTPESALSLGKFLTEKAKIALKTRQS